MTASALGHEANALLQVTSAKHIQQLVNKMGSLKFSEGTSLHDMKEHLNEFKDHVTSVLQDPSALSASDIKLLTDVMAQLDTIFLAELRRQHTHDVAEYNTKLGQHVKCTTDKDKRIGNAGDVTKDQSLASEKREKHKACRKAQLSFELFKADAAAVGQSLFGSAIGVAESTPVSEIDTLCAKKATWDTDSSFYKQLAKVNHVALCHSEQKAFEDMVCAALTAKASTCIAYDECIVAVDLSNEKSVTEAACSDREAVEVVLAKTKCHLLHLSKVFNNEDSTSDCGSVTVDNSELACSLQAVPAVSPCSDEDDISNPTLPSPAGSECSAWRDAEYSFTASYKQVSACQIDQQCILPTQIGTHDYSDGCVDSADLCAFYDRHRDACGDYPADGVTTHCCACGGGTRPICDAAVACSGHGTTIDMDSTDGCICECATGYSGTDCSIAATTAPNRCDYPGVCPPAVHGSWTLTGAATWTKGAKGKSCTEVCTAVGKTCTEESRDLQARVCTEELLSVINVAAGGTGTAACKTFSTLTTYAGSPFQNIHQKCQGFGAVTCTEMSECSENVNQEHEAFCACL